MVGSGSQESFTLLISNRFDTAQGGVIGSDATISLTAASVSVGGILDAFISNRPGTIDGSASITFGVSGNLTVQEVAEFEIDNADDIFNTGHGGTIKSNATINLSASNIGNSTGGELDFVIFNRGFRDPMTDTITGLGGTIGGDATINVNSGNISTSAANEFFLQIANQRGTIGSDAMINVNAASISAGDIFANINSTGGTIGGSAAISMNVSGTAKITNDVTFEILGSDGAAAAAININGGSYDAGGTFTAYMDGWTAAEPSHSIMPAFTQMCSKWARSAQTVCSTSAAAPSRLIRR